MSRDEVIPGGVTGATPAILLSVVEDDVMSRGTLRRSSESQNKCQMCKGTADQSFPENAEAPEFKSWGCLEQLDSLPECYCAGEFFVICFKIHHGVEYGKI
jgi:hypothetical protein